MEPHFADANGDSLCGEAGQVTYLAKKIGCGECRVLLRSARRQRIQQETAQAEINRILKKRQNKLRERLLRKAERRTPHLVHSNQ